jgi:O-methyltransferase involved in polyketide biosynthesis
MAIQLDGVEETLLLPLWGRAYETRKSKPLLADRKALEITEQIDYDFSTFKQRVHPLSRAAWIARSIYFDNKIIQYLKIHPDTSIINAGCGLDTTYDRLHNNTAIWYEIDFPEVIDLRKRFIQESANRIFLPCSLLENTWYDRIQNTKDVFLMMAGVIYYFDESQVKQLFQSLSEAFKIYDAVFDYSSPAGLKMTNKKVLAKGGMDKNAYLKWGVKNIHILEKWNLHIKIIENITMFHNHKKLYPFQKRIGMIISDMLSVMSLVHIKAGLPHDA